MPPRSLELPVGTRQIEEGYWLGGLMGPGDVPALRALGVRVVVSAVMPLPGTLEVLRKARIAHRYIPMGKRFKHAERILSVAERYPAEQIFIHCRHGADRTGCIVAFLLVVRHGWSPGDALYSVVYPTLTDTEGLARVLKRHEIQDQRPPQDPSVGFYSVSGTGRTRGGLKIRNEGFEQLVSTALRSMHVHRALGAQPARSPGGGATRSSPTSG